jgi:hypothetical protein
MPLRFKSILLLVLVAGVAPAIGGAEDARPVEHIRRELVEWRKTLDTKDEASAPARKVAAESIAGVHDPRAVAALGELWEIEKKANPANSHRQYFVAALMNIGDRKAFLRLVEISVEDPDNEIRRRAASWIGAQDNRDDAIPLYVRYLRSAKLFHYALNSLGYTQITKKGMGPPNPELVAALIDNLITVTPVRKRVPRTIIEPLHRTGRGAYRYGGGTIWVWVTEYESSPNPDVKALLYEYTHQDLGYDQTLWRKTILKPLKSGSQQ